MTHQLPKKSSNPAGRPQAGAVVCACLMMLALVACDVRAPADVGPPVPDATPDQRETDGPLPERVTPLETDGESTLPPEELLAPVLADASERSGLAPAELAIRGAWRRTWSDGSLGCPRPGEFYTQALVPGWQVVVVAGERELDYRLSDRGHFILCPYGLARGGEFIEQ